jgi:predicted metalloprotease with PDZ domain
MPQGEPQPGDQGLDRTHTWGRTYWGGAMFCLVADVEIRQQTHNRLGLQDALRAIVAAGGTIDHNWTLPQALAVGDQATGTHVLTDLYAQWKDTPVQYDLPTLWAQLGIRTTSDGIEFSDTAPLANIREAITRPKQNPITATIVPTSQHP